MKINTLKQLVQLPRKRIERLTREHPEAALAWEGLVIKEFMERCGIVEATRAVREFYAFKREQVHRLGLRAAM